MVMLIRNYISFLKWSIIISFVSLQQTESIEIPPKNLEMLHVLLSVHSWTMSEDITVRVTCDGGNPVCMWIIFDYVRVNTNSKWEFQCPHVSDVSGYKKIVVTWLLDEAIWLQIDNGTATIINRLITFNRRQLGSSKVYTIVLNDFRYRYYYDEATGDFSMTIQDAQDEDSGLWECRVELHKNDGEVEDTKTDAYVLVGSAKPKTTLQSQKEQKITTEAIIHVTGGFQDSSLLYNIEDRETSDFLSKNNTATRKLSVSVGGLYILRGLDAVIACVLLVLQKWFIIV